MKILVVGSGGREHALVWKITQSPMVSKVYCAPGNAGTSFLCENVPIGVEEIEKLVQFARENADFTVIGPEKPLVLGIVDRFNQEGLKVFGPTQKAAELEGSKSFAKNIMNKYGIPTADFSTFTSPDEAKNYLETRKYPLVVKADGLAAGKGVIICWNKEEALGAITQLMEKKIFGAAGAEIVIEEFLQGEEASFLALVDGENLLPLASAQDHKAVFDADQGPNTGGMGAYSPAPIMSSELMALVKNKIAAPVVKAMKKEGRVFKGVLYIGLMIDKGKPKVLEFNCRFGDPEIQPLLLCVKSDIVPALLASVDGNLDKCSLEWLDTPSVCVVMASKGYPGSFQKGLPISGLDNKGGLEGATVFHSGVDYNNGQFLTSGGRVLGVAAVGKDIKRAIDNAYKAVHKIHWEGVHFRKDIGKKALNHELNTAMQTD